MPHLGQRSAKQLVFEFQTKYNTILSKNPASKNQGDLIDTLKALGFTKTQISLAINNIDANAPIEEMVEDAIKVISNEQHKKITQTA
jgi:Holliday junction resolvasome RuvABC DNA-binding subunit